MQTKQNKTKNKIGTNKALTFKGVNYSILPILFFVFSFLIFLPSSSASIYDDCSIYGTCETLEDLSSSFMPFNKTVFGNFSFNGDCLDGGIEFRDDGTICGQRLEIFNITSVNVTKQTVTVTEDFIIDGNVGIGTTTPQNTLNVIGDGNFTGNLILSSFLENSVLFMGTNGEITEDNINFNWNKTSMRLGVGEPTPLGKIHISAQPTLGTELHTNANAASDPNGNEADATTGFTSTNLAGKGANIFASQSSIVNTGSFALEANATDTPSAGARFQLDLNNAPFSLVDGKTYRISFDARHIGIGGGWVIRISSFSNLINDVGLDFADLTNTDTTFQTYSLDFVHSSANNNFGAKEDSGTNDGGIIFDDFSVRELVTGADDILVVLDDGNIGVNKVAPIEKLDVIGNINIDTDSAYLFDGSTALRLAKGIDVHYANTLVGVSAGDSDAARQTAIGYFAGWQNTGERQTAVGYQAGLLNTGIRQTAVGVVAGHSNTGDYETAIGYNSGRSNSGDNLVAIGYEAGKDNTVDNQFIVQHANVNSVPLIQGNFSSGYVGIGTITPSAKLDVNGNVVFQSNLDMTNGSITNLLELVSTDGSRIATGTNPVYSMFSGLDSAEIFSNNQSTDSGVITHALLDTNPGNEKVLAAWQSGKNDSGQYTRNSAGYFPDLGLLDLSILTNTEQMWFNFGITPLADYFSRENRTAVAALYAFESQKLFLHDDLGQGELLGEGMFAWILRDGEKFNIREGALHISDESIKEFGFPLGANITIFFEDFETVTLDKFTLITSGKGLDEWASSANTLGDCPTVSESLVCIHAGPLGGSGDTIIQTNFTTINLSLNNLEFYINTLEMSSGGDFEVIMNNNVGSGDISIYSTTTDVFDQKIVTTIPVSMDDQTLVTMEVIFSSSHPNKGDTWIDQVVINATTTASSLQNVSVQEGRIEFGNEECFIGQEVINENMGQEISIVCNNINIVGNTTFVNVEEQSLNVTGSIELNGIAITDWAGVINSPLFPGYFLLNGSSVMQGDSNFGGFNMTNVDSGFFNFIGSSVSRITKGWFVDLDVSNNITVGDRYVLGNGASIGYNATCAFIFYNQTGSIIETKGCV